MNNKLLSGLNIAKIASSLNKTLGVINKAIPIYLEVKPILKNAPSLSNILDMMNNQSEIKKENNIKEIQEEKKVSNNLPTFFQ